MASKVKLSRPVAIRWAMVVTAGNNGILINILKRDEMAMHHATGTPFANKTRKLKIRTIIDADSTMDTSKIFLQFIINYQQTGNW